VSRPRQEYDWGGPGTPEPAPPPEVQIVPSGEKKEKPGPVARYEHDPLLPADLLEDEKELVKLALSDNTKKAYMKDWVKFAAWCAAEDRQSLPASVETLRGYVTHLYRTPTRQTKKPTAPGSIGRALAAVAWFHENSGILDYSGTKASRLRLLLKGIRRKLKARQTGKDPLPCAQVRDAARRWPRDTVSGLRDRCLLLLGSAAALRRSEFTSLLISDLVFSPEGLIVHFGRLEARATKGDQEASKNPTVVVPRGMGAWGDACPVRAAEEWIATMALPEGSDGPLLRPVDRYGHARSKPLTDAGVAVVVKKAAKQLGLNRTLYSGHSLRSGCATTMANEDVPIDVIRVHLRQKNIQTTIGYVNRARSFKDSAWSFARKT
jgi:site-specific recombinase XerD